MLIQPTVRECIQVADVNFLDIPNLKCLIAVGNAAKYSTFRSANGTAGYQVTTGKTLKFRAARVVVVTAAASGGVVLGYGDTDVNIAAGAAPTNPVYLGGSSFVRLQNLSVEGQFSMPVRFDVPAGKYPFIFSDGLCAVFIFGYEE